MRVLTTPDGALVTLLSAPVELRASFHNALPALTLVVPAPPPPRPAGALFPPSLPSALRLALPDVRLTLAGFVDAGNRVDESCRCCRTAAVAVAAATPIEARYPSAWAEWSASGGPSWQRLTNAAACQPGTAPATPVLDPNPTLSSVWRGVAHPPRGKGHEGIGRLVSVSSSAANEAKMAADTPTLPTAEPRRRLLRLAITDQQAGSAGRCRLPAAAGPEGPSSPAPAVAGVQAI